MIMLVPRILAVKPYGWQYSSNGLPAYMRAFAVAFGHCCVKTTLAEYGMFPKTNIPKTCRIFHVFSVGAAVNTRATNGPYIG